MKFWSLVGVCHACWKMFGVFCLWGLEQSEKKLDVTILRNILHVKVFTCNCRNANSSFGICLDTAKFLVSLCIGTLEQSEYKLTGCYNFTQQMWALKSSNLIAELLIQVLVSYWCPSKHQKFSDRGKDWDYFSYKVIGCHNFMQNMPELVFASNCRNIS